MGVSYTDLLEQHLAILKGLQYNSGLFAASNKNVDTGYDKSWLRDNFYECLPFFILGDYETAKKTAKALLQIFHKHDFKISHAVHEKPKYRYQYIHARFHPETFEEFWEEWGNKQNDAVGAILFLFGELEHRGVHILETPEDFAVVQKLVHYLGSLQYWQDPDSGMWEEDEEIHASSIGACVAGLLSVRRLSKIHVPLEYIRNGKMMLNKLLPRESEKKFVDLALLSLIYPYQVTTPYQTTQILRHVEYHLKKRKGVIRYKNDYYYNKNPDGYSEEAEWTFGFAWLAIIYTRLQNKEKAKEYEELMLGTVNDKGTVPELYYSDSDTYNENDPLGWSEAMFVIALYELNRKHVPLHPHVAKMFPHVGKHFETHNTYK